MVSYNFEVDGKSGATGIASPYVSSNFSAAAVQVMGTGIKYVSKRGNLNAALGLTQTFVTSGTNATEVQLNVKLKF